MPEYADASAYLDRALSEIELTAPGADMADPGGAEAVVFREKKPDPRGIRAFHEVGGAYGFTKESGDASPRPSHPAYIGG